MLHFTALRGHVHNGNDHKQNGFAQETAGLDMHCTVVDTVVD